MFANILKQFVCTPNKVKTIESTLIVAYNDYNSFHIICDPGGIYTIDPMLIKGVELGDAVILTYINNHALSIQKANKHVFSGFIQSITLTNDEDLQPNYYYELHPKLNVRGQINLPINARLLIPRTIEQKKIILPNKPIVLEYVKGPIKNYYEVI